MALATICPHCGTRFRVASDQLKLRGGIVRCGACNEVFDGSAALVDPETPPAGVIDQPAITPPDDGSALPVLDSVDQPPPADSAAATIYTIDFDTTLAPRAPPVRPEPPMVPAQPLVAVAPAVVALPVVQAPEAAPVSPVLPVLPVPVPVPVPATAPVLPVPAPEAAPLPAIVRASLAAAPDASALDDIEHLVALPPPQEPEDAEDPFGAQFAAPLSELPVSRPLPVAAAPAPAPARHHPQPAAADSLAPLLMRASAADQSTPAAGPPSVLPPAAAGSSRRKPPAPPAPVDTAPAQDEPEFVRSGRLREESGASRRRLLMLGVLVLVLTLVAQGVWNFRSTLAARYPAARPQLVQACALIGCTVELPAQIEALAVETGELQSLDASAGNFAFTTLLRNQGELVQAWPHLELALTDANDKTLVRRVFSPADYLPAGGVAARGFAARSEQPVKLAFQLNQLKASGYHLAIFYP